MMAPETRTRRALGWPIVPPLEVRVALEELAVVPVAEHVVSRAAAAQRLRDRCGEGESGGGQTTRSGRPTRSGPRDCIAFGAVP
jgi:hypothetical protein